MPDGQVVSRTDIARLIARELEVDDAQGQRVGRVRRYDLTAGWLLMTRETPAGADIYVPLNATVHIDERSIRLSLSRTVLDGRVSAQDIAWHLASFLDVYDLHGHRVGTVRHYDLATAWLLVERKLFRAKDFYVPFSAIDAIDARGVHLSVPKQTLDRDARALPPGIAVVEGPRGSDVWTTTEDPAALTATLPDHDVER